MLVNHVKITYYNAFPHNIKLRGRILYHRDLRLGLGLGCQGLGLELGLADW